MSTATLQGHRVTTAKISIPAWGLWWAECEIDEEATLTGSVQLVAADQTFVGTIMSGGPSKGSSSYRIAGGFGGWGKLLPAKPYNNDAQVKLATVIGDSAREAGETIDASTLAGTVGPHFVRLAAPASWILNELMTDSWYVGVDGVTRFGKRAVTTLTSEATRGKLDLARGTQDLSVTSIVQLVPGVTVDGREAVDVEIRLNKKGIEATIWFSGIAGSSRRLAAFRRMLDQLHPWAKFLGVWEYRIVTQEGNRLNLQPVRASLGMPDLRRVKVRPGVPGWSHDHAIGSLCLVTFVNADPGRPVVVSFDDAESPGFAPDESTLETDELFLECGATGAYPTEHATSIEALAAILTQLAMATPAIVTWLPPPTGTGGILTALAAVAGGAPIEPATKSAIDGGLAAKLPNPTGLIPGLGWPKVRGA
jgi:hypothetical protein